MSTDALTAGSERILRLLRDSRSKTPGTLGETDTALIKEAILLPMMLTQLERDRVALADKGCRLKFAPLWLQAVTRVMDAVTADLAAVRRALRQREIKLYLDAQDNLGVRYMYVHRGYSQVIAMSWNFVRVEITVRMREYARLFA